MKTRNENTLLVKLQEEIANRAEFLAHGGAKEYSEYKESVGYILGLEEAIRLLEEITSDRES